MAEISTLDRRGLDALLELGCAEGWNLGRGDAEAFWAQDSSGFLGVTADGAMAGGGSIVAYGERYGFMGLFLVKPGFRGQGIGRKLWYERRDRLLSRLAPGAPIGLAAVAAMRSFYERGGFRADHLEVRFEWTARAAGSADARMIEARALPRAELVAFDAMHFPCERPRFLDAWIAPPDRIAIACVEAGAIEGLAVSRPAMQGNRIGPLFARDESVAEALLREIERRLPGQRLLIDMPESNPTAAAMAQRRAMRSVFSCTRMHHGTAPRLPWHRIFGITSFELG